MLVALGLLCRHARVTGMACSFDSAAVGEFPCASRRARPLILCAFCVFGIGPGAYGLHAVEVYQACKVFGEVGGKQPPCFPHAQ